MIPWFFGGNSAKGDLLTTKKKEKKECLEDGKKRLGSFLGYQKPYALFCIKESREQLEDVAWGSGKGWIPQTTQRMANRVNSMQGTFVW